jgi:EAL domain-containing protein (putative c-di-GMP-specific phosphodiesterase class I)
MVMPRIPAGFTREEHGANVTLFREGDRGDAAYLIESGCVEIVLESGSQARRLDMLSRDDLFGELALIDHLPRTATARTVVPTVLLRIDSGYFEDMLARCDPMVHYLLRLLLGRFRNERASLLRSASAAGVAQAPADGEAAAGPRQPAGQARDLHEIALRTLTLSSDLAAAIDEDQLELRYQPIVHLDSLTLAGYEALVRWRHPRLGLIGPDEFIPMAERSRLIHRIGQWVLHRALRDWPALRARCAPRPGEAPFIGVNLSAPELSSPGIAESVLEALAQRKVDPRELRVELTETTAVGNLQDVSAVTTRLLEAGVGIALDDFGTGYAGLSYLQGLPISCLKIDRVFVSRMGTSERSLQIVRAALELARPLGMVTVAEGIEEAGVGELLASMGCTYGQGYLYARPLSLTEGLAWKAPGAAG